MYILICFGKWMCLLFVLKNREIIYFFGLLYKKIFFIKIYLEFENVYFIYGVK